MCLFVVFETDDAFISIGTGLERVGVVGLDQDCWRAEPEDAGSFGLSRIVRAEPDLWVLIEGLLCKNKGKRGVGEGFVRGRSDA